MSVTPLSSLGSFSSLRGALLRYRIMTYIVGSALIILVFVGVPLQLWANFSGVAKVEGTIHGYLYLVYLATAADLARRARWRLPRILAVVLSGFVPVLAFVVEHRVVRQMKAEWEVEAAALQGTVDPRAGGDGDARPGRGPGAGGAPGSTAGAPSAAER